MPRVNMDGKIIEEVQKYPVIYAKNLRINKRTDVKENAWKSIASSLGLTVEIVKSRWNQLRDKYGKEKNAIALASRSGAGATSKPKWEFYSALQFLDFHMRKSRKETCSNLELSMPFTERESDSTSNSVMFEEYLEVATYKDDDNSQQQVIYSFPLNNEDDMPHTSSYSPPTSRSTPLNNTASSSRSTSNSPPRNRPMKKMKSDQTCFFENLKQVVAAIPKPQQTSGNMDMSNPDVMFCMNLAGEMSSMTDDKKKKLKKVICDFMYS